MARNQIELFYIFRKKENYTNRLKSMNENCFPILKVYKTIVLDHNINLWKYSWAFKN